LNATWMNRREVDAGERRHIDDVLGQSARALWEMRLLVTRLRMVKMATYVLIPGAGGDAWYWHRLAPELTKRGHDVVAVDLPAGDDSAGLLEYADTVVDAIGDRRELVLVAQSMGGFTAPLVCERMPVDLIVLLNAMVPAPGESPGDWWNNVDQPRARAEYAAQEGRSVDGEFDVWEEFFHDVPFDVIAQAKARGETPQSGTPFAQPWPLEKWPDVPTRFLQGRHDRLFPLKLQRRIVRERLGIALDELPGGHLVALSRPEELAERLESYRSHLRNQRATHG
jgi:pimeloyl-ACP methyl ester carboxylesterase